jgi:signal peptidase I
MTHTDKSISPKNLNPLRNTLILDLLVIMFVVMMAFGASVLLREYVITVTEVKGTSMESTLFDKDEVLLFNYPLVGKIKRGDIVRADNPLYDPEKGDKYMIKRVIAVGGDEVRIPGDGCVYVNGEKLGEDYILKPQSTYYNRTHDDKNSAYINGGIVPEGCVFVLGDNREQSEDSRRFGEIKENTIYGRAFLIRRDGKNIWL